MIKFAQLPKKIKSEITYHYPADKFVKRPKYSNHSARCWDKKHAIHDSILEADYCNQLALMLKAGEILEYKTQHKIDLTVEGVHVANYYADFLVLKPTGRREIHETKGYWTDTAKIKWALSKALNPHLLHVVKYEKPKFFIERKK